MKETALDPGTRWDEILQNDLDQRFEEEFEERKKATKRESLPAKTLSKKPTAKVA